MKNAVACLFGLAWIAACHSDLEPNESTLMAKVSPSAVSVADAWSLFDRSASSGFTPDEKPIVIDLDRAESIAAVKILGPSPYRLEVRGRDGTSLGFDAIDLSTLEPGWHAFTSNVVTAANRVELHFHALGAARPVPEIELWSQIARLPVPSGSTDLTARELPPGLVPFAPTVAEDEIAPANCASFDLEVPRSPTLFRHAYLAYETRGLFRGFSLTRTVNGMAEQQGAWLADDATLRAVVDRIDPEDLHLGSNTVRLCLPDSAKGSVRISNLRIVGELDNGVNPIASVSAGERNGDALIDGDPTSTLEVAAGEHVTVDLERLTSVDSILLSGTGVPTPIVDCV
ncbi:MAG: hypothetical protein ABI678_20385, partial [Kofleriaceae bacterium]